MASTPSPAKRRLPRWRLAGGVALLAVAAGGAIWPQVWTHHQESSGRKLLSSAQASPKSGPTTANQLIGEAQGGGDVTASAQSSTHCNAASPIGVLSIKRLGMVAPVKQGTSDSVLDVAVGHEATSPWPGKPGISLLLSHNVGYFQNINSLKAGDQIVFTRHCVTNVFTVKGKQVTSPGKVLAAPRNGYGLTLVTCWPANALFWTKDRLVVNAELAKTITGVKTVPAPAPVSSPYRSALPKGWTTSEAAARSSVGLSTLHFAGTPAKGFVQSLRPRQAEQAAVLTYFAAESAVKARNRSEWKAVALAKTPLPKSWPSTDSVKVVERVRGNTLQSVSFTAGKRTVTVAFPSNVAHIAGVS